MEETRQQPEALTSADDGHGGETGHYRRYAEYSGVAIFALCLGAGLLLVFLGPEPVIPAAMWILLLIVCLASAFFAASGAFDRRQQRLIYAVAVLASWSLVLTAPDLGMLLIILVLVAAVGSYLVSIRVVFGVIVLNCAVVILHMSIYGADLLDLAATAIFALVIHLASVFSTYALYRETQLREELEQKNLELEAAGILLEDSAATAERLRISRELHDAIGHQLTVLNLELEAAKHRAERYDGAPAALWSHIDRASEVAKGLLADVRSTVGELRASDPGDLQARLARLAAAVPSLQIRLEAEDPPALDDQQVAALVRAAQEIITNTVKHSGARELWLKISREGTDVVLTGVNDGLAPKSVTPGHGLTGLRERAELLGGAISVTSRPQFTVKVQLPLREETL